MITHELIQGSPEWLAYRATHFNASDAPAMMGVSPYKTRAELLREMHTGLAAEVDVATQKRFDNGHRVEALARPLAEEFIGKELFAVVGELGKLSASFDGLTIDDTEGFEHKALNAEIRAAFAQIESISPNHRDLVGGRELPIHHRIQMEQQMLVSGATRILFMSSEWAGEELVEERHCWYTSDAELRAQIIAGWDQFERDLAAYVPPEPVAPAPVGRAPITLPALRLEVNGGVTASNLPEFKLTALSVIRAVNLDLQTDQDFADAEQSVKWCADVETRLDAAKQHALSQTKSIDELFKAIDDISAEARRVRLDLEYLVKARKVAIRAEMVSGAIAKLREYLQSLNDELAPASVPDITGNFAAAIKGKRSIETMRSALDDELAVCKIEAESKARGIRANLAHFQKTAVGMEFLFVDLQSLIHKSADDFEAVLAGRIRKQLDLVEAQEKQRQAEEAARIAAAEQRAREQEAARIAAEQAEAERLRLANEEKARAVAAASTVETVVAVVAAAPNASIEQARLAVLGRHAVQFAEQVDMQKAAIEAEPATLKLGDIATRLGFTLSAQFVSDVLAIKPAKTDGRAVLYRESDWRLICQALVRRIESVYESNERSALAA